MTRTSTGSRVIKEPLHVRHDVSLRLLALELGANGDETYEVSFRPAPGAALRAGRMRLIRGTSWEIVQDPPGDPISVTLGTPDEVFRLALGQGPDAERRYAATVARAAPHYPPSLTKRLAQRRLSGCGTVAFDAGWFLSALATSAFDRPMLFPQATSKLGLVGLERASATVEAITSRGDKALARALRAAQALDVGWDGEGRLIAEFASGELAQLGADVHDGCRAALGRGPLQVVFDPHEPLGLGLGPLVHADGEHGSVGVGLVVGEVDEGGAAERAGVRVGMALARLSDPDRVISRGGQSRIPFEAALNEIDARRAAGRALAVTFDTAAAVTHLYAVEMPAAATLAALAAASGALATPPIDPGGTLNTMCAGALLWREAVPRLFIGEPSSHTCAHTDICPQLEIAHGLFGTKLLGVASHDATPRLVAEHAGESDEDAIDVDATVLPTDRPLTRRASRLLGEADLTLALLQQGDLAVFDSGALHFASNGAVGISAAVYHGAITAAAVPRLRLAAHATEAEPASRGAYRHHLSAADLLREVEPLDVTHTRD